MSEMIERVARALCTAGGYLPDATSNDGDEVPHWTLYVKDARAAIVAMREPTDDMRRSGWEELRKHNEIQTRLGNSLVGVETPVFAAMIEAALKP